MQNRQVKRALRDNVGDFLDNLTNEVNTTHLVEWVVAELDLPFPDETDPLWEWAQEAAERFEKDLP
jgi:hypothetical protein